MRSFLVIIFAAILIAHCDSRWTEDQAWKWYNQTSWSAGVNYIPAYADNQIQMWESFDANAINTQIQWATKIGFSKFRTFLHIQPFLDNKDLLISNIFKFLVILKNYKAQAILVLFDDCWHSTYHGGKQPDPIPGLHNSQWVQCPGTISYSQQTLESYVTTIVSNFAKNQNVAFWDLYNQVGNSGHLANSLPLLKNAFTWARSVNPIQPLSSGVWNEDKAYAQIIQYIYSQSDIITFHAYCDVNCTEGWIQRMKVNKRPTICTQYMARTRNSKFITHLPVFKKQNVWAINWGFVFGRTQTYYPWQSKQGSPVPAIWFHDVLHPNGTAFDPQQTALIRNLTSLSGNQQNLRLQQ